MARINSVFDGLAVSLLTVNQEWTLLKVSEREDRVKIEEEAGEAGEE